MSKRKMLRKLLRKKPPTKKRNYVTLSPAEIEKMVEEEAPEFKFPRNTVLLDKLKEAGIL